MLHPLVTRFAHAGLPLQIAAAPIATRRAAGTADIVQIDIAREPRARPRGERFRLWHGAAENRVEALGIDRRLEQLVLLVHEPRRRFELEVSRHVGLPPGTRVLRQDSRRRWIEQLTSERKRHFLCGMDEQHLFIALLPEAVSTVRAAHEALRDPRVTAAERAAPARTIRQGEWFFVALSPDEEREVELRIRRGALIRRRVGIAQAARIRRLGRPHVADEVLFIPGPSLPDEPRGDLAYVRGKVHHPDHRTVELRAWRRVVPNREALERAIEGVGWID